MNENPYAAPGADLAAFDIQRDDSRKFFHYRLSSRNVFSVFGLGGLIVISSMMVGQVVKGNMPLTSVLVPVLALMTIISYFIYTILYPRVFEFRVGGETIRWQRPWPKPCEETIKVVDVERVEYDGSEVVVTTCDGTKYRPSSYCYGRLSSVVVQAITSAVKYQLPDITVASESSSIFRSLRDVLWSRMSRK